MEYPVRFARSDDGTAIASWRQGTGPPLVVATLAGGLWPPSTIVSNAGARLFYDLLSRRHMVIAYDARGMGLSQRDVANYSLGASSDDLRAVADLWELEQFALLGFRGPAKTAVQFAATHPERVARMVLRDPILGQGDHPLQQRERALQELFETDFDFFLDAMSLSQAGWETGRSLAEGARGGTSRETLAAAQQAAGKESAWPVAQDVACPTLVVHSRTLHTRTLQHEFPVDVARRLAATIPHASFAVIDGGAPYDDADAEEFAAVTLDFFAGSATGAPQRRSGGGGTAVILFADIADSTAQTERMGDTAFRAQARALDGRMRAAVREQGGVVIDAKTLGDGILATFASASQAITAALACAAAGEASGGSADGGPALRLHIGLHAGDVIREEDNVFGGAVNIAARISALSAAGEVLVSATVRDLGRTSAGVVFEDRGEFELKGVGEAVRVYAVRSREVS